MEERGKVDDGLKVSQVKAKKSVTKQALIIVGLFLGGIFVASFIYAFSQGFLNRLYQVTGFSFSFWGPSEYTNSIGITMVNIPAGSFMMGSCKLTDAMVEENKKRASLGQAPLTANCANPDSDASDNETPQHRVSINKFQMGKTEVTLGQFKRFIAEAGRNDLVNEHFIMWNSNGDNAPVVMVNWNDAQDFIAWLNKTDGGGYRLPSEAEWEYACRAGSNHKYCGSNDIDAVAWYGVHSSNGLRAVGGKQANAFGLHDMSGNVWEWTQDCWNNSYNGAPINGAAWSTGDCGRRVDRGGSWDVNATYSRSAFRGRIPSTNRGDNVGFRLARMLP